MAAVETVDQPTEPLEILLDPAGERTVLCPFPGRAAWAPARSRPETPISSISTSAETGPDCRDAPAARTVAQMPLDAAERRPAAVLVGSRADLKAPDAALPRASARRRRTRLPPPLPDRRARTGDRHLRRRRRRGAGSARCRPAPTQPAPATSRRRPARRAGRLPPAAAAAHAAAIAARVLADRRRYLDDRIAEGRQC